MCGSSSSNNSEIASVVSSLAAINFNLLDANNDVDVLPVTAVIYGAKVRGRGVGMGMHMRRVGSEGEEGGMGMHVRRVGSKGILLL